MNDVKRSGWSLRFRSSFPPSAPFTSLHSAPFGHLVPAHYVHRTEGEVKWRDRVRRERTGDDWDSLPSHLVSPQGLVSFGHQYPVHLPPAHAPLAYGSLRYAGVRWVVSEGRKTERTEHRTTQKRSGWASGEGPKFWGFRLTLGSVPSYLTSVSRHFTSSLRFRSVRRTM